VQLSTVQRAAAVVLTTVLLAAAGQGAAFAADPQWESAQQWGSVTPTATQP
jgi:hypothetical protein